jgi:hypothetical protein
MNGTHPTDAMTHAIAEMVQANEREYRRWLDETPNRRWSYLTVRTGLLFGKNAVGSRIIDALQERKTEWSYRLDNTGLRWTWHFRAYLSPEEHAELAARFNAKERA